MRSLILFVFPIILVSVLFFSIPFTAKAIVPFGGIITLIRPCLGGGLVLATIAQPPPLPPIIEVASIASPFLYFMMSHPAQLVLGLMTSPTGCWTSPHTLFIVPFSSFYGTSP